MTPEEEFKADALKWALRFTSVCTMALIIILIMKRVCI